MLLKFQYILETINIVTGRIVSWMSLLIVILMFMNVVQRYIFASNHVWQQELVLFIHAVVFLSAAGYTLKNDKHVRVDVFYASMSKTQKSLIDFMGTILFLFPVSIAIIYFSYDFINNSWIIKENSREADGMEGVFLLKSFIIFFAITLILQGAASVMGNLSTAETEED